MTGGPADLLAEAGGGAPATEARPSAPGRPSAAASTFASGVLNVDKPIGWTSHDVVAVLRGVLAVRRVGHGGTLDPLATGVLPVLVGSATRYADRLHGATKVYAALVRFGHETATDDAEGAVTREAAVPGPDADLEPVLRRFLGDIAQVPPAYAAVKVSGRRAYAMARSGQAPSLAPRTVTIERLEAASWDPPDMRLLVVCGRGTYVRALARDIGRAAGSAAHLAALRRLAVGALRAAEARPVEDLRKGGRDAALAALQPADDSILGLDPRYRSASAAELLADRGRASRMAGTAG